MQKAPVSPGIELLTDSFRHGSFRLKGLGMTATRNSGSICHLRFCLDRSAGLGGGPSLPPSRAAERWGQGPGSCAGRTKLLV